MIEARLNTRVRQRGLVLVITLLLLIVVTILAISMFRSFGTQEQIAGNVREKHRALQAAESAQQYAEWWLSQGNGSVGASPCNAVLDAGLNQGQVCSNILPLISVPQVPWGGATPVGTDYLPPGMNVQTTSAQDTYYRKPRFYISLLGSSPAGTGTVYQVDAVGYGGSPNAIAVVESVYVVSAGIKDLGGL